MIINVVTLEECHLRPELWDSETLECGECGECWRRWELGRAVLLEVSGGWLSPESSPGLDCTGVECSGVTPEIWWQHDNMALHTPGQARPGTTPQPQLLLCIIFLLITLLHSYCVMNIFHKYEPWTNIILLDHYLISNDNSPVTFRQINVSQRKLHYISTFWVGEGRRKS